MRSAIAMLVALAGAVAVPAAVPTLAHPPHAFTIEPLADGIYAVIRREPAGLATHANNIFIVNDEDVMVVDTSQSPALTREVLAELRKITAKPVRYVINTHWHDDHYIGDQVYREAFPDVDIVTHARTLRDLPAQGAANRAQMIKALPSTIDRIRVAAGKGQNLAGAAISEEERAAYASDIQWAERYVEEVPGVPLVLPTIGVTDRLTLYRGARVIDVLAVGAGHSQADLIVHLPTEQIVIAGDLVTWPVPIAGLQSSPRGWAEALARIRGLHASIIVPGHGPVLRDDSYLRLVEEMLSTLTGQVDAAVSRGETLEQARSSVRLDEWRAKLACDSQLRGFQFDYFLAGRAVEAAYREATERR